MNTNETADAPNMNTNETTDELRDSANGEFISFSNDTSPSNWRKTPLKSSYSPHQNRHEQFSPPQGFSSPIHHQRNFNANRRQSGNSYGDRFGGNQQSYNRGNNWKNRKDNRLFNNSRNYNKSGGDEPVDISKYFHPSMIQDPWRHLLPNSTETNTIIDQNCEESESAAEAKEEDEPGDSSNSPSK